MIARYVTILTILLGLQNASAQGSRFAVRFFGTGTGQMDRIKIPLASAPQLNVGGDFTIEFWMRSAYADNDGYVSTGQNGDGWITGNVIVDRDIYGGGDYGDFGIAMGRNGGNCVLAFGAHNGSWGETIVGTRNVGDNQWHHVAVTRSQTGGTMRLFVDGSLDASGTGPAGNLSYRIGRSTSWPDSDPFLVIGAEKHDAGSEYPSFNGSVDEFRVWSRTLGTGDLAKVASRITPPAGQTGLVAYFRLEEGAGTALRDSAMGCTGTLHSGTSGNGEWLGWAATSNTAPVAVHTSVVGIASADASSLQLSWFCPRNFRHDLQATDQMWPTQNWLFVAGATNLTAADSNTAVSVSMPSFTGRSFRVTSQPYR